MPGFFGSDFDASQPPDSAPRRDGAMWLRDIRTRLKTFMNVSFDLETGVIKPGSVTGAGLETIVGLTPGVYAGITVDAKGRVTSAAVLTTLTSYGITDAVHSTDVIDTSHGGTGNSTPPGFDGMLPISAADGTSQWALLTSTDSTVTFAFTANAIDLSVAAASEVPFFATITITSSAGIAPVTIVADTAGKQVFIDKIAMSVSGAAWAGAGVELRVQDTNGTPVVYAGATVAQLTASVYLESTGLTLYAPYKNGVGSTSGKGLVAVITGGTATSGGDVTVTVSGIMK